jgi:SsrA-binding protein
MEEKIASLNRQAFHHYEILERFEAGMMLQGTEVKSIREGKVNLKDSYGLVKNGEVWLLNCHISPYSHGNRMNHDPLRTRKLLLHRSEIRKLIGKTSERGLTLVPTKIYFHKGRAKCEIALAKGKKLFDKRETERRKTADREARQAIKARR